MDQKHPLNGRWLIVTGVLITIVIVGSELLSRLMGSWHWLFGLPAALIFARSVQKSFHTWIWPHHVNEDGEA